MPPPPVVEHFAGSSPDFSAEQDDLLRAVDRLRNRLKRSPRMTEVLDMLHGLGYRRLAPGLVLAYDAGLLPVVAEATPGMVADSELTPGGPSHVRAA